MAIEACDRLLKLAARPDQHQATRLYRMVALAQAGRSVEGRAGRAIRSPIQRPRPASPRAPTARPDGLRGRGRGQTSTARPDRANPDHPPDRPARPASPRSSRRGPVAPRPSPPVLRRHGRRPARRSPRGAVRSARPITNSSGNSPILISGSTPSSSPSTPNAIDRAGSAPVRSPWFESRYGMALAYYRADRPKDARQLIDATSILHPTSAAANSRPGSNG